MDGGGAGRGVLSHRAAHAPRVLPVGRESRVDRDHRRARAQHPGRLHGPGVDRSRRLHVRRRLYRREPRQSPRLAVAGKPARRWPDGGAHRRDRRYSVAAHQGALPGHRHPGGPAHHRVDDQPRDVHQRRRAGLDRGRAAAAGPDGPRHPARHVLLPPRVRRAGHRGHDEPHAQPDRARVHRHPRPGHRGRDHRHQHLPLQAPGVRDLVLLRRGDRGALHVLPRHRQLRAVPDRRLDRLSRDDHHRRARIRPGVDLRRDLRDPAADRHPVCDGGVRRDLLLTANGAQSDPQPPPDAVRRPHHLLPDRGARGAEPSVAEHPKLLQSLAVRVLSTRARSVHMRQFLAIATALIVAAGSLAVASPSLAQSKSEIVIGVQCDRTGPTQIVGTVLCPGFHDYIALVNSKGGVDGHPIKALEIDHEYKVPAAVESYERHKKEGAVTMSIYGTPQIYALAAKLTEDRIPGTSPGFGSAAAADVVKKQLGGSLKGKKIAFIFYDNPAGREPIEVIEDLATKEGFTLKIFAVPPPGVEMGAQVLDIAQRFRADYVIGHLFGGAPSVSIKEFKRVGYPLRKFVSFVWGAGEANIEGAGGFGVAEGYYVMQFAGVGPDYPVLNEIREMYKKQGKPAPKEMASTVYYNRGVLIAALHVEAISNALKAHPDGKITGVDVKNGFEKISNFTLGGLVPPLKITPTDHEGGGLVQIWQVKGGKFEKVTDWYSAYPDVVAKHIKAAAAK